MLSDTTSTLLDTFIPEDAKRESWNIAGLVTAAHRQFGLVLTEEQLKGMSAEQITKLVSDGVKAIYDTQKKEVGDFFEQLARMLMLQTIDQRWKEHLERIDRLKEGIHLRAHAQKDPLIEYKKEAFNTFQEMNAWIQEETIEKLLKIRLVSQERAREVLQDRPELDQSELSYAGADENAPAFQPGSAPAGSNARASRPFAQQPNSPSQMTYSYGPGDDDDGGPKMNREQRRRAKMNKKKRI